MRSGLKESQNNRKFFKKFFREFSLFFIQKFRSLLRISLPSIAFHEILAAKGQVDVAFGTQPPFVRLFTAPIGGVRAARLETRQTAQSLH